MPDERLPQKILYGHGELQVGKRSYGGHKKQYKKTLKASEDFNIPTGSWEQIAQDRAKWRGLRRRAAGEYEAKESAKPNRNVRLGKPELRNYQQSFLPRGRKLCW